MAQHCHPRGQRGDHSRTCEVASAGQCARRQAAAATEEKKESVELSKKLEDVAKTIEGLTALELSELVKGLEDRLGIQAAARFAPERRD